jgi:hypothetical protein
MVVPTKELNNYTCNINDIKIELYSQQSNSFNQLQESHKNLFTNSEMISCYISPSETVPKTMYFIFLWILLAFSL